MTRPEHGFRTSWTSWMAWLQAGCTGRSRPVPRLFRGMAASTSRGDGGGGGGGGGGDDEAAASGIKGERRVMLLNY